MAWWSLARLQLHHGRSPDHVLGRPVLQSTSAYLHLGTTSPLACASLVLRIDDGRAVFSSFVRFDRPRVLRAVRVVAGSIHRAVVPTVLTHAIGGRHL